MSLINRRDFLIGSALATAGLVTGCTSSRILGANDEIRFGVIGIGSKGADHVDNLIKIPGTRLVALADPDPEYYMNAKRDELAKLEIPVNVDVYTDFRRILDRKDIDAVIIASPNYWHAHHAIYALQAGKHVYVEKPVSHDVWQGRQMVELARNSGLVILPGLQNRSRHCWPEIMDYLKEDHLGKIICARGLCYKRRKSIGLLSKPATPPKSCDYNLWLGPAQDLPLMRPQFHYDWHWVWNTGNGDVGNQGVHQMDIARLLIGEKNLPEQVLSIGGRFGYKDAGETPNTQMIFYDYRPVPLIFEVRGLPDKPGVEAMSVYKQSRISTLIECEGGYISDTTAYDKENKRIRQFSAHGGEEHLPAFINAIRNNKPENLPCSIEDGHISTSLCHIGNISHRIGQLAGPEEISESIRPNVLQSETWQRMTEHLTNNNVDLEIDKITFGANLIFDPTNEIFTGSGTAEANALLKDDYREEWTIPAIR